MERVNLSSDVYMSCLSHALSTEREEVMGLLLGEYRGTCGETQIDSVCMMRRSDKREDRVEISPEQLSSAAIEADALAIKYSRDIKVVGWYHSHPHITVWPSHVDVQTQADYQLMDSNFVGLIFSCFHHSDKKYSIKTICFQSLNISSSEGSSGYEHIEIPLRITPTVHRTYSPMTTSTLIHLVEILHEEQQQTYEAASRHNMADMVLMHNSSVYLQSLVDIVQVIGGPLLHTMHQELTRNRQLIEQLTKYKAELTNDCTV